MKSIEQEWLSFSAMIFDKVNPAPNQVDEMRKAFFAGAWAMLCAVKRIGEPDISETAGMQYLEARQQEGERFYRDLITAYAEGN